MENMIQIISLIINLLVGIGLFVVILRLLSLLDTLSELLDLKIKKKE